MRKIKRLLARIYIAFLKILPIKQNRIYFVSNFGTRISCNPKAFFEYLYKNHKREFEFYYCLNKKTTSLPKDVKSAKYKSLKDLYYLYTSKYIVNNFRFHSMFFKRNKQIYIQTWHGGPVPQKKIENDAVADLSKDYINAAKNDSKQIDLLLTGSSAIQKIFSSAFWYNGKVTNFGTPRYDSFFQDNAELKCQLKKQYSIKEDSVIILYAPTFRNNSDPQELFLDNKTVLDAAKKYFNRDVTLLYRFHPHLADKLAKLSFDDDNVINVTDYPDSVDLEILSDVLITDFSSCLADFFVLKKPCFLIIKDYENYLKNERELYMNLNQLPYPIFKSEKEFAKYISTTQNINSSLNKKIEDFSIQIGLSEKGIACSTLYDELKKL